MYDVKWTEHSSQKQKLWIQKWNETGTLRPVQAEWT